MKKEYKIEVIKESALSSLFLESEVGGRNESIRTRRLGCIFSSNRTTPLIFILDKKRLSSLFVRNL